MTKLEIESIDHIVMQAADLAATITFYTEIMGMHVESFQPPGRAGAAIIAFWSAKNQSS